MLADLGAPAPALRTLFRSLKRCQDNGYRDAIARACARFSAAAGGLSALVMYDCTTLHFETGDEDAGPRGLRKVGMSKEHRAGPQAQVGLLVDPSGFPLEVHLLAGNTAGTTTLLPVLTAFAERHGVIGLVVVADAGMLSAGNLNAIEDAGFSFIVGSRITRAPYDLAGHFTRHGDYFADGQILESARVMGSGKDARKRRVVYQYQTTRHRLNRGGDRALNRAIHVIASTRMRCDPATIDYLARRRAEGKTDREIRRCLKRYSLKRYIARQLYRALTAAMAAT